MLDSVGMTAWQMLMMDLLGLLVAGMTKVNKCRKRVTSTLQARAR